MSTPELHSDEDERTDPMPIVFPAPAEAAEASFSDDGAIEVAPPRTVIEVSSAVRLPFRPHETGFINLEHNRLIAEALETTLEQLGIDPETVVLSGYRTPHQKSFPGGNEEWREEIRQYIEHSRALLIAAQERSAMGWVGAQSQEEALAEDILQAEQELASTSAHYYFAPVEALRASSTGVNNPVDYARTDGVIGVYQRSRLLEIDPDLTIREVGGAWVVNATPAEVDSAKVMIFKPRYVDEAEIEAS